MMRQKECMRQTKTNKHDQTCLILSMINSTQCKKLVPNALRFTYYNLKPCKSHWKNETKYLHQTLNFQFFNRGRILMFFGVFFHVWIAKHLAQASWSDLTLSEKFRTVSTTECTKLLHSSDATKAMHAPLTLPKANKDTASIWGNKLFK